MNIDLINGIMIGAFAVSIIFAIINIILKNREKKASNKSLPDKLPEEYKGYTKTFVVEVRSDDNDIIVRSAKFTAPYLTHAYSGFLTKAFNSIRFHELKKAKRTK